MKKYKVGIIGNGGRSVCYGRAYAKSEEIEVTAIADPCGQNQQTMLHMTGLAGRKPVLYSDWRELYERHPDLDGVVVATPNYLHRESAVPFLERGIPVALEKPMTTTMGDSEAILDAVDTNNGRILIGFVLRSTPFYRKIHELIEADTIGRILTVQADELGSYGVTSIISRSPWRRYVKYSGGSMMEKSSHDIDLLNWLIGSRPTAVSSFGGSLLFRPNPLFPAACKDCLHDKCKYNDKPEFNPNAGDEILQNFVREGNDLCIYNIDKDVADNQSVSIQYANGAIANFMLSFNCSGPRAGRNFHAVGTRGRIWGNIDDSELWVYRNAEGRAERHELTVSGVGHNGGDENHALELLRMMRDTAYRPDQDAYAGYLSNAVCIAADISAAEARQLRFRYDARNYISFV